MNGDPCSYKDYKVICKNKQYICGGNRLILASWKTLKVDNEKKHSVQYINIVDFYNTVIPSHTL